MTLDARGKYVVIPEIIHHAPLYITPPDTINHYPNNPKWMPDVDVLNGVTREVDCETLPGGRRYGEQEDSGEEGEEGGPVVAG